MTIREHLKRSFQRMLVNMVVAMLAPALIAVWLLPHAPHFDLVARCAAALLGFPVAMLVAFRARRFFLCPRCGAPLHGVNVKGVVPSNRRGDTDLKMQYWDECPRCGIGFDAPYEPISG